MDQRTLTYKSVAGDTAQVIASKLAATLTQGVGSPAGFTFSAANGVISVTKADHGSYTLLGNDPVLFVKQTGTTPGRIAGLAVLTTNGAGREASTRSVPEAVDVEDIWARSLAAARESGLVAEGDLVVITAGTAVNLPGTTNVIKVDVA